MDRRDGQNRDRLNCNVPVCSLLVFMAVDSSSVAIFLFALLLGIFSMTAWVFIPSSKTLAAMKVLPAIVNNQRMQGVAENALELTERFLKDYLETQPGKKGLHND